MEQKHVVGLSSSEIGALWTTYISDSLTICYLKHFLQHLQVDEIQPLIHSALELSQSHVTQIESMFTEEHFPIPKGYSDVDVDLSAPPLFFDLFPLSFVYAMSRHGLLSYGILVSNVAREDVRSFFSECLKSSLELFNRSIDIMLEKGIYDRPPMIPYPDHVEFVKKKETFLSKWYEEKRPLNVLELSEMFFNIERNYVGLIIVMAFLQVVKDEKIKKYLDKGKELALKQIKFLNETMMHDDLLGNIMLNTEVTTSTRSPFSDQLILGLLFVLNQMGLTTVGHGLSVSSREDLITEYSKIIVEVMNYAKQGADIMIERGWLEQPPQAPNRRELSNTI